MKKFIPNYRKNEKTCRTNKRNFWWFNYVVWTHVFKRRGEENKWSRRIIK